MYVMTNKRLQLLFLRKEWSCFLSQLWFKELLTHK